MDRLTARFALTGDPEIDQACPSHPRLLDEVVVVAIDGARLMLVGGLSAPVLARHIGALDVLAFLRQLDGSRTLAQLCASHLPAPEQRKRLLYRLLRHGLLEQPARGAPALEAHTAAFLARVMDQTRIHQCRDDAAAAFLRPLGLLGGGPFGRALALALQQCGLTVIDDAPGAPPCHLTIALLDGAGTLDARIDRLQGAGAAVLLVSARALTLDIGPLLVNRGCCTTACYRASGGAPGDPPPDALSAAWLATVCNAVVLLASGTASMSLVNNFIRYQIDGGAIGTSAHPVARRHALGGAPGDATDSARGDALRDAPRGALAAPLGAEQLQRLERHSRVAVPPRRLIGVKNYDQHYAPKNLLAAKQLPLPHGDAGSAIFLGNASAPQRLLLELIIRAFGYWPDADGQARRICPSGGNLGAAECLVLWHDQAGRRTRLLRYVPLADWLEPLADVPLAGAGAPEYAVVCVANVEKARQKYADFGLSLGLLDGGMSAAFFQAAALAADQPIALGYGPLPGGVLGDMIAQRGHYYRFAWRAALPSLAALPAQWERFDSLLRQRRAVRDCPRLDLAVAGIGALLRQARPGVGDAADAALLACLHPLLVVERAGVCATYEWVDGAGLRLCPDSTIGPDGAGQELLSQRNLSRAAGRLFMLADLPRLLNMQGAAGHDRLLTLTGQWIGSFWLAIESRQLRGCPAGATIESDLLNHLPAAYGHLFTVFAFTFGNAGEAGACSR